MYVCYTYIRRKRGERKLWTTDFYGRQRRKRRRKRRTTLLEDIIIGILLFLCVREKGRERVREREKSSEAKSSQNTTTKKKKKERTRVIFDVKAFFSILISREESQLQSASQKHHNKTRTNHHQISHINNVCGWDWFRIEIERGRARATERHRCRHERRV